MEHRLQNLMTDLATTPILPGLLPDPTICRAGGDFYLANSSMEYSPGIPIWHSDDLLEWKQIGNAAGTHFPSGEARPSAGQYAPTLRFHDGTFFLVGTNLTERASAGHWIMRTEDPRSDWTAPVFLQGVEGIDPDISWTEDGSCLLTYCSWDKSQAGIKQVEIDPVEGVLLEEPRWVWHGSGLSHPEGPHIYRRGTWWYLVIAEGGTERGHVVSVARATSPRGPFVGAPHNPIFSHRSTRHPVQNIGHADLVELADGSWAAVYLGVRPRGRTPRFHVNGRETYLAAIDWSEGWPVFRDYTANQLPPVAATLERWARPLHPRWVSPGVSPSECSSTSERGITLRPAQAPNGAPSGLFTRIPSQLWEARFRVDPQEAEAHMILRIDERHFYSLIAQSGIVRAISRVGDVEAVVAERPIPTSGSVDLIIRSEESTDGPDLVTLHVRTSEEFLLASLDGRYLSTEVAGGFTGRTIGIAAEGGEVVVEEFRFNPFTAEHTAPESDA